MAPPKSPGDQDERARHDEVPTADLATDEARLVSWLCEDLARSASRLLVRGQVLSDLTLQFGPEAVEDLRRDYREAWRSACKMIRYAFADLDSKG